MCWQCCQCSIIGGLFINFNKHCAHKFFPPSDEILVNESICLDSIGQGDDMPLDNAKLTIPQPTVAKVYD